jgi:hypothetical protein
MHIMYHCLLTAKGWPTPRCLRYMPSGKTTAEEPFQRSGSLQWPTTQWLKCPSRREDAMTPIPMWVGDRIYFLSDRNGEFNLFSCNGSGADIRQHTTFHRLPRAQRFGCRGKIVFEQAGYLHSFDIAGAYHKTEDSILQLTCLNCVPLCAGIQLHAQR